MSRDSLSIKSRPTNFRDIKGQDDVVADILDLAREGSFPAFSIFHGPSGSGKTSSALALARLLKCNDYNFSKKTICKKCEGCQSAEGANLFHVNCAVENIRDHFVGEIRQGYKFYSNPWSCAGPRVHLYEEIHCWSKMDHAKLLKLTEMKNVQNVFIFTTTVLEQIYKPLVSRFTPFSFRSVSLENAVQVLIGAANCAGLNISEDDLWKIAEAHYPDLRSAVNLLPLFELRRRRQPDIPVRNLL